MIYAVPVLISVILLCALKNKTPAYDAFISGAEEGFKTVISVFPPLLAVLSAAAMLRASGAVDAAARILSPLTDFFKIPSELLPLALIRPLSGSGALGLLTDTVRAYGANGKISAAACILCASTETTFYTLSVYFGGTKAKNTHRVMLAAIIGDLIGLICACTLAEIFF